MGDQEGAPAPSENYLADPVWTFDPKANTEGSDATEDGQAPADGDTTPEDPTDPTPAGDEPNVEVKEEKKDDKTPEKKDPPIRAVKTKEDFIIERKQRQLEKARSEAQAKKEREELWLEEEDEEIDPSDSETVKKVLKKEYGDRFDKIDQIEQDLNQRALEQEIETSLSKNPLEKYMTSGEKARFKEYALHPSRSQIPHEELIISSMGVTRIMEIGAIQEREATKKAAASKVGGSVWSKSGDTKIDFASMTDAQFEDHQMKVRMGKA